MAWNLKQKHVSLLCLVLNFGNQPVLVSEEECGWQKGTLICTRSARCYGPVPVIIHTFIWYTHAHMTWSHCDPVVCIHGHVSPSQLRVTPPQAIKLLLVSPQPVCIVLQLSWQTRMAGSSIQISFIWMVVYVLTRRCWSGEQTVTLTFCDYLATAFVTSLHPKHTVLHVYHQYMMINRHLIMMQMIYIIVYGSSLIWEWVGYVDWSVSFCWHHVGWVISCELFLHCCGIGWSWWCETCHHVPTSLSFVCWLRISWGFGVHELV